MACLTRSILVSLFVSLFLASACSSSKPSAADTGTERPAEKTTTVLELANATEPTSTVGEWTYQLPKELEFTATLFDGSIFEGSSVAASDVLFWFWAPT